MVFFPDNANRGQRVNDLTNDIAFIQQEIVGRKDTMKASEAAAYEVLGRVATAAGYPTIDAYIKVATDAMTSDQRAFYLSLREKATAQGRDMEIALTVFGAIGTVGILAGAAVSDKFLGTISDMIKFFTGFRGMAQAVSDGAAGATAVAESLDLATTSLEGISAEAQTAEITTKIISFTKLAAKITVVAAVLASVGTLIYDAVTGDEERDKLRNYIVETASKRFMVKGIELNIDQEMHFEAQCVSVIDTQDNYNEMVASGILTEDQAKAGVLKAINKHVDAFKLAMAEVTDAAVLASCAQMDRNASTWTDEDPTLSQMKQWIQDNYPKAAT